jgi:hypothetical protein
MTTESEPDFKQIIKDFIKELIEATDSNSTPQSRLINIEDLSPNIYELGRQMNLSSDYKALFAEKEKQTFKEIFPTAFISFVRNMRPLVSDLDDDKIMTYVKIWLSTLYFIKNEIFNYYEELCGGNLVKLTSEFESNKSKFFK